MKCLTFAILLLPFLLFGQPERIKKKQFFETDSPLVIMELVSHFRNIASPKFKSKTRPAYVSMQTGDGWQRSGQIEIKARGHFRFDNCETPPILLYFNTPGSSTVGGLGKVKMVWGCENNAFAEQLVLKEYLAYKIYKELTPYSFQVRRAIVKFSDSASLTKVVEKNAFFIEDIDEVAKRVLYREWETEKASPVEVDRSHYMLLTLFQYLIGNTDWGLSSGHNIKFIVPKESVTGVPIAIPYDFDFSGLVDAPYASVPENFPIQNVRERFYMCALPDSLLIGKWIDYFLQKKSKIFDIINHCDGLDEIYRREIIMYVSDYYTLIENREKAMKIFLNPQKMK